MSSENIFRYLNISVNMKHTLMDLSKHLSCDFERPIDRHPTSGRTWNLDRM